MNFKLSIEIGNDNVMTEGDVARLLREVATKMESGRLGEFVTDNGEFPSGPVRDANGNKVGEWEVVE